ncbi:MAG: cob(I)yrinic acid a,c-diamide adenosyltransferase [Epsilonproteobacteria bacterium]|nr:cob(I)yrinic acid a,c-diamide adenosyltransferase [Campylobacterota bacterium]NPA64319.1 cob(I)yrinic acid a,c-diamide adenosyltransferase [Campylobacterota bacterium]
MIQIYTGDGKGKTTAAAGLALRAVGAGKKVAFFQFMKGRESGEVAMLSRLGVVVDREWDGAFVVGEPTEDQRRMVQLQYHRVIKAVGGLYDLVVLDEIIVALGFGLLRKEQVLRLFEIGRCELVLTGRGATKELIDRADLVTEMKKIKHYFDKGVAAREGIEF